MRTSVIQDDELGLRLLHAADGHGLSLSAFLAEAGSSKLRQETREEQPFELIVEGRDGPLSEMYFDKHSELLATEDQSVYGR